MEFRILGPLGVHDGDRLIELGSPKQRSVLAVLLVEANRVVSLDRLIHELWGDEPPAAATGTLQSYISNLRRVLEPHRPPREPPRLLVTQPPGYVLLVTPESLDAARFEAAAAEGRRLLAEGRPSEARERLQEALGWWRGAALGEFSAEPFAQTEAARLEELRLVAGEDLTQAELDVGGHAGAVAELEALVAAHPLRERLWGLLMVALYRSGRQADALRAYQAARRTLGEELGIEPGPALRRLEADILAQAPALEWSPPRQAPPTPAGAGTAPARSHSAPTPLPPIPPSAPEVGHPFIGRAEEMARLQGALEQAGAGRGGAVVVAGEAGIGKTRLVEELVAAARARGWAAAWGGALEGGGTPAYWPWVKVVRDLLDTIENEGVAEAIGVGAVELAQVVPEVKEVTGPLQSPPALDPDTARLRLFQAVAALLGAISRRRPLVVVLDDLHWADAGSLQLAGFLAPSLAESSLLLVGLYRPAEVDAAHPLTATLATLARHRVAERLALDGLGDSEVAALIAATTGTPVSPDTVAAVRVRTGGNPFFVGELARLLASEQALGPESVAGAVPAGVRDVVRRRLGRLPEQTVALLSMAAVAGREFDLGVLEAAAGLDPDRALELVEAALMSGVVAEDPEVVGRFRFSHDLVREVIAEDLSALRRARLHARLGEAVQDLSAGAEDDHHAVELAHHFGEAAPVIGPEKGIAHALRAAEVEMARLAHEGAGRQLRRALDLTRRLPPPEAARRELPILLRLASLLAMTRGYGEPETGRALAAARARCEELGETQDFMPVLWGLMAYHLVSAQHVAARRLAEELLEVATASARPADLVSGHLAVGVCALHQGEQQEARSHLEEALANEEGLRSPWPLGWLPLHPWWWARPSCRGPCGW